MMIKIDLGATYTKEERDAIEQRFPLQCEFKYVGFGLVELVSFKWALMHGKEIEL